jgi:photosystem II stability/assembly factor-like uncharacterized protein
MFATRRGFLRGLVAAIAATALPMSERMTPAATAAPADPSVVDAATVRVAQSADWAPIGPDAEIRRLFTPSSGALFASSATSLFRSDDAGGTWNEVTLPGPRRESGVIEVDPTDQRVVYAETNDGLQRSDDDGVSWNLVLPLTADRRILKLAISPADPGTLYVAQGSGAFVDYWFLRSRDRGATWEQLEEYHQSMCGWGVYILTPHPTDPNRLFRTTGCYAGRNLSDDLEQSRDFGATWQKVTSPRGAFPHTIIGGSGADPSRLILAADNDHRSGGSLVLSSPDDGKTWANVLENKGGGTATSSKDPSVTVGGLAYNPAMPENLYVGLNSNAYPFRSVNFSTTQASSDGGATWSPLGQQQLPPMRSMALGIDGLNLFAASSRGVMRLALG